jgi:DNA-binding beta-propeller fold protein YncE
MNRLLFACLTLSLLTLATAQADSPPIYYGRWGATGTGPGQFRGAHGVAVDPWGDVYAPDYNNHRIQKFDALGTFIMTWGSQGTDTSHFEGPWAVATSKAGNIYVTELIGNRVQEFTRNGLYIRKWGSLGTGVGQFQMPSGIAISANGAVYVSERQNNRIQEFDLNGNFIRAWGSAGFNDGQFNQPLDVAVGLDGSVYVADVFNTRIQKFDSTGTFVAKWDWSAIGYPNGIAVDPQGNLLVTDAINARVVKLDPANGNVLTTFGSSGNAPGQFMSIEKVAASPSGFIYVSDSELNFISLFAPVGVSAPPSAANPGGFFLFGSVPNPVRGAGKIRFDLSTPAPVTVGIYDISGRLVRLVCENVMETAGPHELPWDAHGLAAGIYQVLVRSGSFSSAKKVIVLE